MKQIELDTNYPLLQAYEKLALLHQRRHGASSPPMNYENYNYTLVLLNINAAIIEGIMRKILSEIVLNEINFQVRKGTSEGRSERSPPENLLNKFIIEINSIGGWSKLKEQYLSYLRFSIDTSISSETKSAMDSLFTLRNIFAHGTTLIYPKKSLPEEFKEEPVYKWQNRLQGVSVYLEKHFKEGKIFDNLAHFGVPEHFFIKTQSFFTEILPKINHTSKDSQYLIEVIQNNSFGYRFIYK